ncbi:MAG: hypothetical protein MZV63_15080 [Marinilabiliales bacterium]|nr:hypothetical protein [Marinilabiliales bacterium]
MPIPPRAISSTTSWPGTRSSDPAGDAGADSSASTSPNERQVQAGQSPSRRRGSTVAPQAGQSASLGDVVDSLMVFAGPDSAAVCVDGRREPGQPAGRAPAPLQSSQESCRSSFGRRLISVPRSESTCCKWAISSSIS